MKKRLKPSSKPKPLYTTPGPLTVPTTRQVSSPSTEKMRTSLLLSTALSESAKQRATEMGMSFNAFAAGALYREILNTNPHPTSTPLPKDGVLASMTVSGNLDHPSHSRKKDPLAKFGPGFTYTEEGDGWFASWDQIERYNTALATAPDEDWRTLGPRLNLTQEEARAADLAVQMPEFEAYMNAKYGTARDAQPSQPPAPTVKKKRTR